MLTAKVGSSTTVGASSHAHHDRVVPQPVLLAYLLHLPDQYWQILDESQGAMSRSKG